MEKTNRIIKYPNLVAFVISTAAFLIAFLTNFSYATFSGVILIISGIFLFFFFAFQNQDLFNIQAIFSGVWFISIGLSCLRLNKNQIPWLTKTWICFFIAYTFFLIGCICTPLLVRELSKYKFKFKFKKVSVLSTVLTEPILFRMICVLFFICVFTFLAEVAILKYIPAFSNNMVAYYNFHVSGLHYFTVSIIFVAPISFFYYQKFRNLISTRKKIIILLFSFLSFSIPVLIVSRQLLLLQIIVMIFVFYYFGNKKQKLMTFVLIAFAIIGYFGVSNLRNQNEDYLRFVFNYPTMADDFTQGEKLEKKDVEIREILNFDKKNFSSNVAKYPMAIYQPYMYISFNFDNFNYSVARIENHSLGSKTLYPLLYLTPFRNLRDRYPDYKFVKYFNTNPIIYPAYYDFGVIGIAIYMFLIGLLSKWSSFWKKDNVIAQIGNYLLKYILLFSFFTSFFASATFFFYLILLICMNVFLYYRIVLPSYRKISE